MKTHGQTKQQGEALFERGVLIEPLRGCPVVLPVRGGGANTHFQSLSRLGFSMCVRLIPNPPNWRGLKIAPLFGAKVINFAWFSSLSKHRGAATSSMKMGRVSFFLQVREQVFHNALKALHKFNSFFANHHSENGVQNFAKELQKSGGA